VINLINNAIKYTPPRGEIDITVGHTINEAFVKVKDSGIGIAPDKLEKAFDMFHRVDPNSHFVEGLGVGLGIAKKLAEMHGGKITPHSREDRSGCEFVVTFPLLNLNPEEKNTEPTLVRT
jgi:signal transduction histidine kinase